MGKVVCFGEIMLRLTPPNFARLNQASSFDAVYGGGEANVAVSLSNYGIDTSYITKLPENAIGQSAVNELRKYGVDTQNIVRGGNRIGIYFFEKGASQRSPKVVYDRKYSSIAEAKPEDFNWNEIFKDAQWFHISGITPALGTNLVEATKQGCIEAKKRGITISCDINYRANLWSLEEAGKVMTDLMQYVDVCIANEKDAEFIFGLDISTVERENGKVTHKGNKEVARILKERFGFTHVATTVRESISASYNNWSAILYDGQNSFYSKMYSMQIVDRIGGGDSFSAGLIYAMLNKFNNQDTIEFATAASCLKHTIEGDSNQSTVQEALDLMQGDGSGIVKR